MTAQTLAELKAINEAAEQQEALADAEALKAAEAEELYVEEDEVVDSELAEDKPEESTEETEEWAKPEGSVPVAKHVEMKHKLKGRLDDADAEIARLTALNEQLQSGAAKPVQQQQEALRMPLISDDDVAYDDQKYAQRMADYTKKMVAMEFSNIEQSRAVQSQQKQQDLQLRSEVDKHYERAAELVSKGSVTADNYQAADHIVRKAMVEVLPGMGEAVLDNFIARLGEGSEKVIYHLGVSPAALAKLKDCFKTDSTGFAATIYLGELKAKFNSALPDKTSKAPRPDVPLSGKAQIGGNALHQAYKRSFAAQDGKSLSIKREAKAKGIDTSQW